LEFGTDTLVEIIITFLSKIYLREHKLVFCIRDALMSHQIRFGFGQTSRRCRRWERTVSDQQQHRKRNDSHLRKTNIETILYYNIILLNALMSAAKNIWNRKSKTATPCINITLQKIYCVLFNIGILTATVIVIIVVVLPDNCILVVLLKILRVIDCESPIQSPAF